MQYTPCLVKARGILHYAVPVFWESDGHCKINLNPMPLIKDYIC